MKDEPIIAELQRELDEAEWLCEEDREKLTTALGQFREICAKMEGNPAIGAEEAARRREKMRGLWLDLLEACRAVEVTEGELIGKGADRADAMRALAIAKFRVAHQTKKALEEGNFTGSWEEREQVMEIIGEVEERREALLEDLTAEDIRQLSDEGVL